MSGQNLRLLKFPHTTDEIITERIEGLHRLICESANDIHVSKTIEMLISYISSTYEGTYPDQVIAKLIEAHAWWNEIIEPDVTMSVNYNIDE